MKMLGNALLSAAIVSAPALASDVKRHSDTLNSHTWQPTTISAVQERANGNVPNDLEGVAPCSPSDVYEMILGKDGNRTLSKEETIEKRYKQIDDWLMLLDKEKDGKLKGREDEVVRAVQSEVLQLKLAGEDVYSHYVDAGGEAYGNVTKYVIGIEDQNGLALPAGVNDYVTGKSLSVGQVMLGGCVVTSPDEPDHPIIMEVDGYVNGVPMKHLNRLLEPQKADSYVDKYNSKDHFAYAVNYDYGPAKNTSFVHLDTSASHDAHTLDTFFHEIKHTQEEDRMMIMGKVSDSRMGTDIDAKKYHDNDTEIEVRGLMYGMAKVSQKIESEGGREAVNGHIDELLTVHTEMVIKESADMMTLRRALTDNNVNGQVLDSLNSVRLRSAFEGEPLCRDLDGDTKLEQEAINDCLYKIKNPYNPIVAMSLFKDVINENHIVLNDITDSELSQLVNDTVSSSLHSLSDHVSMESPVLQVVNDNDLNAYTEDAKKHFYESRLGVDPKENGVYLQSGQELRY